MKFNFKLRASTVMCAATVACSTVFLAACGGGGGGGGSSPPATIVATLSGTVASGAAYPTGTMLTVTDKNGGVAATYTLKDGDKGVYSVPIYSTAQAPLILKAVGTDVETLYSFSPVIVTGTVNITPITNWITARLTSTGNPADIKAADITTAAIDTKTSEVLTTLAPISTALGVTVNPMTGPLTANGMGMDRLLDSVKIKITPTTTGSNVDVTVVTLLEDGSKPIIIPTFSGNISKIPSLSIGITPVTTIDPQKLVVSGTAAKVTDLVARLQACYALPVADRITEGGTTAAHIKEGVCKNLFSGNNPASYKDNGYIISKTGGHYGGIFSTSSGAKFDLGKFEFLRSNGDVVFSWRNPSDSGATYRRAVAKFENEELKIIGNQYNYNADIRPQRHSRNFINDAGYSYKSTGYNVYVENKQANGKSIFNRVEVTAPNGSIYTMRPNAGYSFLVLENPDKTLNGSGTVMLNLISTGGVGGVNAATIADKEKNSYYWDSLTKWTDPAISAIPQIAQWKFEYFLASNTAIGGTADATEWRSTTARALTLAELAPQLFATYTPQQIAQAQKNTAATGGYTFKTPTNEDEKRMLVDFSADGNKPAWSVPEGVQAPTELSVFGRAPSISNGAEPPVYVRGNVFNDTSTPSNFSPVLPDKRPNTAIIYCSRQSIDDKHCDADVLVGASGKYALGTVVDYFSLYSSGPNNVVSTSGLALYKHTPKP